MLNSLCHLGIRPRPGVQNVRRFATERRGGKRPKGSKRMAKNPKTPSIIDDYQNDVLVLRNATPDQRVATHEERLVIHAYLIKQRDSMKRKVAVLHWASKARDLAFVKGMQDLESRSKSAKGLSAIMAGELLGRLKALRDISPYLPQSALELVFRLTSLLKEKKHETFLNELISDFVANYNHYLDALGDERLFNKLPEHFVEDMALGMNFELLKGLIKRGNLNLITTYLSAIPIPSNVPSSLLNDLISLDPAFMTSRLAANYSPHQVSLAVHELLNAKQFELIPTLLNAVPTQIYNFTDLDRLILTMEQHNQQNHWTRLLSLISPATRLDAHSYPTLARHFMGAQHWAHLQRIIQMHHFNTEWASDSQLIELLNNMFHSTWRQFAFDVVDHLPAARVYAIQEHTIQTWGSSSSVSSPAAISEFLRQMTHILTKFQLTLPMTLTQPSTATTSVKSPSVASNATESVPSDTKRADVQSMRGKTEPTATTSTISVSTSPPVQTPVSGPSKAHFELFLTSRIHSGSKTSEWTTEQRVEIIQMVQLYETHFPNQLNLGIWATYLLCLCDELVAHAPAEKERKALDTAARAFENFFLQIRPKMDDAHAQVLTTALTRVAQYLWSEGRHSSAMSLANVMSYYKLRATGDFEVLVREQASKRASVSGLSPLDWLNKAVNESAIEDASFFNSLFSFVQSAVQFNMEDAVKAGGWKALNELNQSRSMEAWSAVVPIWEKAMKAKWAPNTAFLSTLFRLAQLQPEPQITFFISALQYCHAQNLSLAPTDLPMVYILELLMNASQHTLGQYLLAPSGLNMIAVLPSNVSTKKSLVAFIMRSLAHANDHKTAFFAYRLYSDVYAGAATANFSPHCHAMVDAFFQVCHTKRNFTTAEKFGRSLFPLHQNHNAYPIYLMLIELAGQCGELSSVLRLYKEVAATSKGQSIVQLVQRTLHAVAACNVLPLESQRLRVKLEHPDITLSEQLHQADTFLAAIPPSEFTRRSRPTYISL